MYVYFPHTNQVTALGEDTSHYFKFNGRQIQQLEVQFQDCVAPCPSRSTLGANLKPQVVSVVLNDQPAGNWGSWAQLHSYLKGCKAKAWDRGDAS